MAKVSIDCPCCNCKNSINLDGFLLIGQNGGQFLTDSHNFDFDAFGREVGKIANIPGFAIGPVLKDKLGKSNCKRT
ncbi:MAG: hypothetical protein Q8R31_05870 [Candidatus Omnitrophota bacterium]|nr:hypothetical protein [Candidatus Omnitrophota bacterium]